MSVDRIVSITANTGGVRDRIVAVTATTGTPGVKDRIVSVTASAAGIPAPTTYTVNAGAARTVEPFTTVTLTATSSGTPQTWAWDQTAGPDIPLTGSDSATMTFQSPPWPDTLTLTFRVYGQTAGSNPAVDDVIVTVYPHTMWRADGFGGLDALVLQV